MKNKKKRSYCASDKLWCKHRKVKRAWDPYVNFEAALICLLDGFCESKTFRYVPAKKVPRL